MRLVDLRPYLTDPAWFQREPFGIHGVGHVTRVLIWSAILSNRFGNPSSFRSEELLWAASTHDVGRWDDGVDSGHGARSAEWIGVNLVAQRPEAGRADIGFVRELSTWHQVPDDRIEHWSLELMLLKDADGLDRVRIYDLDPRRLRTQHAARLADAAEELFQTTRHLESADAVLDAAITLGLPRSLRGHSS